LEVVRAVKIYNLSIRQAALEFNMNYRALSSCLECVTTNFGPCDNQSRVWS